MNITLLCIGKIKEDFYVEACNEYIKRIKRFSGISIRELSEYNAGKTPSIKQINDALSREYNAAKKHIKGVLIALDKNGEKMNSQDFSQYIKLLKVQGISDITFLTGSSFGLSGEAKQNAAKVISFSDMTFPHGLFRVMLAEQIYRALTIENNMPYHK